MADAPFKDSINAATVAEQATAMLAVYPAFDASSFTAQATAGLEALELKDRVKQVASALRAHLPSDWSQTTRILVAAMPPALPTAEKVASALSWWPFVQVVEDYGVDEPELSLNTLHALTQTFSGEFAVRPIIEHHPDIAFPVLKRWSTDENIHVRRLVSEGSRPRLPWGIRLKALVVDPSPTLPFLESLKDDDEEYVRRSVANHLNDISKDHPDLVLDIAERWSVDAKPNLKRLIKHALRGLIKAGDARALAVIGFTTPMVSEVQVDVSPTTIALGDAVTVSVTLTAGATQGLMMDMALVRPTKMSSSTKVFKGVSKSVKAGDSVQLQKKLSIKKVTTRVYYPGEHRVDVVVNGVVVGSGRFELTTAG
ncbi:MAG: 3-methyladenine DNA glycosylase AlkC [Myxococcota bacterium]|jgi:3-methyladenine DNA glycosylase AlkC